MNSIVSKIIGILCACTALFSISVSPLLADGSSLQADSFQQITAEAMDAKGAWDYSLDSQGALWLGYYDVARLLRLRSPEGQERLLVPDDRAQAPSGLAVMGVENGVGVLWRDKYPKKGLYFLPSSAQDSKPVDIGGDTEPLARFVAETDDHGMTHILWYGEKAHEATGELHNLYYTSFSQGDTAAAAPELVMPGIYPVMASDASGNVMAFSWESTNTGGQVVSRFRAAASDEQGSANGFRDSAVVADVPEITPVIKAFKSGARWLIVWLGQYGLDRRDFRLEGAYSDDNGVSWKRFAFDDLRGFDVASLQVAADKDGHIVLGVTARDRRTDDKAKQDVYVIQSSDSGTTWSAPKQLRKTGAMHLGALTPELLSNFNARNPSVAFGKTPGEVLVVWEDWRTIRSSLYAALSKDFGKTWTLGDVPLPRQNGTNLGLRYEPNAVYFAGSKYHILAESYTDDGLESKRIVQIDLDASMLANLADAAKSSASMDPATIKDALRQRAQAYWTAMKERDFAKTYEYLDPFFKSRTPLDRYMSTMGKIKYADAKVTDIELKGPIAEVTAKIRASIPAFKVPTTGEVVSRPEREVDVKNTWLLIDGQWMKQFRIESQDIVFTRY